MKKSMNKLVVLFIAFVSLSAFTVQTLWKSDKAHSELGFQVKHLGISEISGTFNDFEVNIQSQKADFSDAIFELKAKVASIDTRVEPRDNHLRSADFFDVEKYPLITFKSTAISPAGNNKYKLSGNLTMKDVTRPVTLDLTYNGSTVNAMNNAQTVGFSLSGSLKRSDFGIGSKFPEPMISDEVKIQASGEFTK